MGQIREIMSGEQPCVLGLLHDLREPFVMPLPKTVVRGGLHQQR